MILHGGVGNGRGEFVVNGMITYPQQIADAILANPGYVRGTPVQLVTCHGGCGPLASELSEALGGVRVTASPRKVLRGHGHRTMSTESASTPTVRKWVRPRCDRRVFARTFRCEKQFRLGRYRSPIDLEAK